MLKLNYFYFLLYIYINYYYDFFPKKMIVSRHNDTLKSRKDYYLILSHVMERK